MGSAAPPILPLHVEGLGFYAPGDAHGHGTPILQDVHFTVGAHARTVVLGPNGAGKSVLLRLMHGLLTPCAGAVRWSAVDATHVRRAQAFVFQRPAMLRRSVIGNVAFALRVAGHPRPEEAAAKALADAALAHLAGRPARLCSGGEQQRVAIARAAALSPQVLFLDEPTANLDPAATRAIEERLLALHASGMAWVMATHDLAAARRLASHVLFLHQGRLVEDAPAAEFFSNPRSPLAAAFMQGKLLC